jgi:hypothetical protein
VQTVCPPNGELLRAANRLQAQLRCAGERGNACLKCWKVLATELAHDPLAALRVA